MITILENNSPSYRVRTEENILLSDGTLAFAVDFETAGERLTYNLCLKHKKPILRILLREPFRDIEEVAEKVVPWLKKHNIKKLNIAGNGAYTLKGKFHQEDLTSYLYRILKKVIKFHKLDEIRSGGQTGVDEAGVRAANTLHIPAIALYPKGFKVRLEDGKDYCDETLIRERLKYLADTDLTFYTEKYN